MGEITKTHQNTSNGGWLHQQHSIHPRLSMLPRLRTLSVSRRRVATKRLTRSCWRRCCPLARTTNEPPETAASPTRPPAHRRSWKHTASSASHSTVYYKTPLVRLRRASFPRLSATLDTPPRQHSRTHLAGPDGPPSSAFIGHVTCSEIHPPRAPSDSCRRFSARRTTASSWPSQTRRS